MSHLPPLLLAALALALPANAQSLTRTQLGATLAAGNMPAAADPAAQPSARIFQVANRAEFWSALLAARGGDTILLAPGDYGSFALSRFRYTGGFVSIRSADPARRARFGQLNFGLAQGIALAGVDVQSSASPVIAVSGQNIRLSGLVIRGATANQDAFDDAQGGVHIRNARDVLVTSSSFQDLRAAIYIQRSHAVAIRHNSIGFVREGVNIATLTDGEVSRNHFHDFQPNYGKGEHPDAIQFWNNGEPSGSANVAVRSNYFSLGLNGAVHGIFVGTEQKAMRHRNIEVSGNIYYGSALHGITMGGTDNPVVTNNVIVASPWADNNNSSLRTPDGRTGGAMQPLIRMVETLGARVERNITMSGIPLGTDGTGADNIDLYDTQRRVGEPWTAVFEARPTAVAPPVSAFVTRPGTAAATRNIGILTPPRVGVVTLDPTSALTHALSQPLP